MIGRIATLGAELFKLKAYCQAKLIKSVKIEKTYNVANDAVRTCFVDSMNDSRC